MRRTMGPLNNQLARSLRTAAILTHPILFPTAFVFGAARRSHYATTSKDSWPIYGFKLPLQTTEKVLLPYLPCFYPANICDDYEACSPTVYPEDALISRGQADRCERDASICHTMLRCHLQIHVNEKFVACVIFCHKEIQ